MGIVLEKKLLYFVLCPKILNLNTKYNKMLGLIFFGLRLANSYQLLDGKHMLRKLKEIGFEADKIESYGCYCQFSDSKKLPKGQPMDEYDLVCFQYSQCLKCLDVDGCRNDTYIGFDRSNEFCERNDYP